MIVELPLWSLVLFAICAYGQTQWLVNRLAAMKDERDAARKEADDLRPAASYWLYRTSQYGKGPVGELTTASGPDGIPGTYGDGTGAPSIVLTGAPPPSGDEA